jgi:toxin-antitoxin system PIN domain toxin
MRIVDANVLIYAVNADAFHHDEARNWLDAALTNASGEPVGLDWVVLLAFWRITTHPSVFPAPLPVETAGSIIEGWLAQPAAVMTTATARHLPLMTGLLSTTGSAGNLVNDAHLAALALEHGATIISYDRDLTRFAGVQVLSPAA